MNVVATVRLIALSSDMELEYLYLQVPAAMITAIASCRAVVRLMEFSTTEAYVHDMTHVVPQVTKTVPGTTVPCLLSRRGQSQSHRPEVHVTTEHITMAEYPTPDYDSPASKSGFSLGSYEQDLIPVKGISDKDVT
ncbi:hypothetical protein Ac2012v2_003710 [Leucoagaricus gongylophorus]